MATFIVILVAIFQTLLNLIIIAIGFILAALVVIAQFLQHIWSLLF